MSGDSPRRSMVDILEDLSPLYLTCGLVSLTCIVESSHVVSLDSRY